MADAFDTDGDESDDEADDRQRLVRRTSAQALTPSSASQTPTQTAPSRQAVNTSETAVHDGQATPFRVYGGGIQSDGVFSNLTAKPELGEGKEEQPPVSLSHILKRRE